MIDTDSEFLCLLVITGHCSLLLWIETVNFYAFLDNDECPGPVYFLCFLDNREFHGLTQRVKMIDLIFIFVGDYLSL